MAIRVVEFSNGGYNIRKLLNIEFWIYGKLSKSARIWLLRSIFYIKNYPNLSQFFFIEEYQFRSTCFVIDIFWVALLLKWCPIFDSLPLHQFSKFNNFLWVCWSLGKNLSNFVPPVWKLHNPYCHNIHVSYIASLS